MSTIHKIIINGSEYVLADAGAVAFDESQSLTEAEKSRARENIGAAALGAGDTGGAITVDSALNPNSTNPVQNKVIAQLFQQAQSSLEALTPDAALDPNSAHPVQNKVICQQLNLANAALEQIVGMIPNETAINTLIDAKLGVIENGTY